MELISTLITKNGTRIEKFFEQGKPLKKIVYLPDSSKLKQAGVDRFEKCGNYFAAKDQGGAPLAGGCGDYEGTLIVNMKEIRNLIQTIKALPSGFKIVGQ